MWIGTITAVAGGLAALIGLIIGSQRPMPNAGVVEGLWTLNALPFLVLGSYVLLGGLAVILRLLVCVLTGK